MIQRLKHLVQIIAMASIVQQAHCRELLVNGSFEDDGPPGAVFPTMTGWDDGPGLGNDRGFNVREHVQVVCDEAGCEEFGIPAGELPEPYGVAAVKPNGTGLFFGSSWGRANGLGTLGSATQIVSVSDFQADRYSFSAWLSSRSSAPPLNDSDYAITSLEFFTGSGGRGESLGSAVFDGNNATSPFIVGSLNAEGVADPTVPATQDNWTFYRATGTIPELAQSAVVVIRGASVSGSGRSGYVDLVSLQVVPEPASVLVLATCFPMLCFSAGACRYAVSGVAWISRLRKDRDASKFG